MGMPIITPGNISRCQSITDVIQSVAHEQTSVMKIFQSYKPVNCDIM